MSVVYSTIVILQTNIAASAGGTANVVPNSGLSTDIDTLAIKDRLYYQITYAYTGRVNTIDSNSYFHGYEIAVKLYWRLTTALAERAFTDSYSSLMEVMMRALGDPAWWKLDAPLMGTNPDIYDFQEGDDALVLVAPEREGNIISWGARARLLLLS